MSLHNDIRQNERNAYITELLKRYSELLNDEEHKKHNTNEHIVKDNIRTNKHYDIKNVVKGGDKQVDNNNTSIMNKKRIITPDVMIKKNLNIELEHIDDNKRRIRQFVFLIVFIAFVIILLSILLVTFVRQYAKRKMLMLNSYEESLKQYETMVDNMIRRKQGKHVCNVESTPKAIEYTPVQQATIAPSNYVLALNHDKLPSMDISNAHFNVSKNIYQCVKDVDGTCKVEEVSITQTDKDDKPNVNVYTKIYKPQHNLTHAQRHIDIEEFDKQHVKKHQPQHNMFEDHIKVINELNERIKNIEELVKQSNKEQPKEDKHIVKDVDIKKSSKDKDISKDDEEKEDKNKTLIDIVDEDDEQ